MAQLYRVVAGDTLSALALRFYGDETLFPLIARANGVDNPDLILVGQLLTIPDRRRPPAPPVPDSARVFALRRAADRLRLQTDTMLAEADDKEANLARTREWAASNPQNTPHGSTPQSILNDAETDQRRRRLRIADLQVQFDATQAELSTLLDADSPLFGERRYTVVAGDTLAGIALRFYGNEALFPVIAQANGIVDPDRIDVGQVLTIPVLGSSTRRTYTVVAGDTLAGIALRFYGNEQLFPVIAQANGIVDPDRIDIGQVLTIPVLGSSTGRTYTVVAGDTLAGIALQFYGNEALFPMIAQANGIVDANKIDVGQVL